MLKKCGNSSSEFSLQLLYSLNVTAKLIFHSKSESLKTLLKDEKFKEISHMSKKLKNGYSFSICNLSNQMDWNPLETVANLKILATKYGGYLIECGYCIYLKISLDSEFKLCKRNVIKTQMKKVREIMKQELKKLVTKNVKRKLRRIDLFYYILNESVKHSKDLKDRSSFVQSHIREYFKRDEDSFVEDFIGLDNFKKSLPLDFIEKEGNICYLCNMN